MILFEMVIAACLQDNPSTCKEYSVQQEFVTIQECHKFLMGNHLVEWSLEHPKWKFKTFKCVNIDNKVNEENI